MYCLSWMHNRELLNKSSRLVQSCFLVRMLYKDIYWLFRLTSFYIHIIFTHVKVFLQFYWLIDWDLYLCLWFYSFVKRWSFYVSVLLWTMNYRELDSFICRDSANTCFPFTCDVCCYINNQVYFDRMFD